MNKKEKKAEEIIHVHYQTWTQKRQYTMTIGTTEENTSCTSIWTNDENAL